MLHAGIVDEVRQIFIPDAAYTKGIRRSIGVPKMDRYLREETNINEDDESKKMLLQSSIANFNTRLLMCHRLDKIQRLINEKIWLVHHIISTDVFKGDRKEVIDEAWRNTVLQPCLDISNKRKVVFITGATGMRKSRLSIDLATHFQGETIKSEKIEIESDSDYTSEDFCLQTIVYIEILLKTQRVLIIVGGSNSYVEKLVEDPIDAEQSVLNCRVDMRVDQMAMQAIFVIVLCINQDIIMHLAKNFCYIIFLIIFFVINSMFH
ncbi:hypothetical protein H5410_021618 [Solanum commersonii]|uniref:Uncharacterized protein n=1 Tax=Solanum commersonii TaxID=4109 RepID=A0A9J5ZBU7_SOLCO|nr:hypothetical protein H5410_021618 [Solanum commersonii]